MRFSRLLAAAALATVCSAAFGASPEIGSAAPPFQLTTLDGKNVSLADATKDHKAVVVIFIATKCPYSNAYNVRMRDLAAAYEKQGVMFLGINSNNTEPELEVQSHAKEHRLGFAIAKDRGSKVAD
ncbi:MAG TPA: redoxin domain-containing protein, partial [Thermoanaerobaculia bacterium]